MKKKFAFLILLSVLFVASAAHAGALALDEVIINVVEGRFLCGEYDLEVADSPKPIALGYIHGEAIVQITTPYGIEEINLGGVQVTLTQNAAPYVTELAYDLGDIQETYADCPICEKSTSIGNHALLPCGHWGCKKPADHLQICAYCYGYLCNGKDHSICDSCKVHLCVHVDIECEFTRNPAPTPYTTKDPDGKTQSYYVDPSGGSYDGSAYTNSKGWSPGEAYLKQKATPPPMEANSPDGD